MGKYFEDYVMGETSVSGTRTITEADIVNFAGRSGDFHELHMSEEFAKKGPFGKRIAHGALIFSISIGSRPEISRRIQAPVDSYSGSSSRSGPASSIPYCFSAICFSWSVAI